MILSKMRLSKIFIAGFIVLLAGVVYARGIGQITNPHTRKPDYCIVVETDDQSVSNSQCKPVRVPDGSLTDNTTYFFFDPAATAASGDITDVWTDSTGDVSALVATTGDSMDASAADTMIVSVQSTTLPGTCNEGEEYHDTDSDGTERYVCTASNTWTKYLGSADIDTSAEIAAIVGDETGSGALVFATSPTFVTPTLGVASATSVVGTITVAGNPALAANAASPGANGIVFEGASADTIEGVLVASVSGSDRQWTLPNGSGTIALTANDLGDFSATTSAELAAVISNETGSGLLVFGTSPTIATPIVTGKVDRNNVAVDDDDCTGEQGLYWYDTTDSAFEFCNANSGAPAVLGGGGTPGGSDTQVQYNNSGSFGGISGLTTDGTDLTLTGVLDAGGGTLEIPQTVVGSLPTATAGRLAIVTDGADDADCTTGSGSTVVLCMANGSTWEPTGDSGSGGADTNSIKEICWPAVSLLPLEAADSIPPITKDAGTNIDQLTISFDDSTDECRATVFKVPDDVASGSTITFDLYSYVDSATTGNFVVDYRHNTGFGEGSDPDGSLTTEAAAADTVQGTAGQLTVTSWTETLSNLSWAAGDQVDGVLCRDANNASDTLTGDLQATLFCISIPRE